VTRSATGSTDRRQNVTAVASVLIAGALTLALSGCVPDAAEPPTPTPSDAPPPTLVPNGTAADNKPFFDYVNNQTIAAAGSQPDGPAFINGLRAGGFVVETMELTPDITTVGVKADSVQFSVRAPDACIIGQWGTVGGYTSMIAAPLSTGKCFIGQTRTIDF
jgi:hypothetical protein